MVVVMVVGLELGVAVGAVHGSDARAELGQNSAARDVSRYPWRLASGLELPSLRGDLAGLC